MSVVYALAIAVLTLYGVNLLWMAVSYAREDRLREGDVPDPDALPDAPAPLPDVTVQVPLYNEPLVAERLIDACASLDYPRRKLEVQVLDDSTDETSRIVERSVERWRKRGVDVVHIRRPHRDGYKAGALQNGLRVARGDVIAIFDADFVPAPDFLLRMVPELAGDRTRTEKERLNERVGMVQARWGHLNARFSLLTRVQSIGLDAHFAVEQRVRDVAGCFMNFNGTAGVWRRACIEDAGGWHGDTIAEDLDLSYRAQMKGWRFRYVPDVEAPAELPSTLRGLRSQQFRWAKGSIEAARKLIVPLWRSFASLGVKVQGTIHLTAHLVYPFVLLAVLLHAPVLVASKSGHGPGDLYFTLVALGLTGFAGFALAQVLAQRDLYADWGERLRLVPVFMAGTIGLSLSNSKAVFEALRGKRSTFVRTPKFNIGHGASAAPVVERSAADSPGGPFVRVPVIAWLELGVFAYSAAGLAAVISVGAWAAVPFQALFATGFGLVTAANFRSPGTERSVRS